MKAVVCTAYGPPEVLVLREIEKPSPKDDEVLIKIHATSVTASDTLIRAMSGNCMTRLLLQAIFGYGSPRNPILGMTLSGVVERVGKNVTLFKEDDEVFAYGSMSAMKRRFGSYAEYLCLPEDWNLLSKPKKMTHQQCAAISYGGLLALHCIKKGHIQRNQKVLIYGASGSIGTMAVQFAKQAGGTVTAVCGKQNLQLVKSLGAEHFIDYTSDDAVGKLETYDLVIDAVGNSKTSALKDASKKSLVAGRGKYISIDDDVPSTSKDNFIQLKEMAEQGKVIPVIDRFFSLDEIVQAHEYVDKGHKRGNVVISIVCPADQ